MLNPENPSHQAVLDIGGADRESVRVKCGYDAKVIPQLIYFTNEILSEMDYMIMGVQYEEILRSQLNGMGNEA